MAMHKLCMEDFDQESFTLFAIICKLEDYRMAYMFNKFLDVRLKKRPKNIDFKSPYASYSLFEYENNDENTFWNLISNIYKSEEESGLDEGLFFELKSKIINYHNLLPELNNIDFLLKISSDSRLINDKLILNRIQQIPQVVTCYKVERGDIISNENLIF